jgi:hypothetical protein
MERKKERGKERERRGMSIRWKRTTVIITVILIR